MFGLISRKACHNLIIPRSLSLSKFNSTLARVCIHQGELEGTLENLPSGSTYASFKGIPYAKSTQGEYRFKAPRPVDKWSGVLKATEHGPCCPHWDMVTSEIIDGAEDCLLLNVYTPNIKGPPAPVMIWFHGGAFQSGHANSDVYGPDYLVQEGVVLVTVNFRLEALGLLCLHTKDVPGNAAMKDQVLAMKWVQQNISQFGGDPGNVTIFGESSGAAQSTYHIFSQMSRGLFHKVIAQSGCCFNEWSMAFNNRERGFRVAKYLGNDTKNVNEVADYLRSVPPSKFIKVTYPILNDVEKRGGLPIFFCPVVEKSYDGEECFLNKTPTELFAEGNFADVPLLTGYNNSEGLIFVKQILKRADALNKDFTPKIPRDILETLTPELINQLSREMKQFYFGNKIVGKEATDAIVDMESDCVFSIGVQAFARTMAKLAKSPVYLNKFSMSGNLNIMKKIAVVKDAKGASHADDLFYLFKTFVDIEQGSEEWKQMKTVTKLWTNFAKYGNPTPDGDQLIPVKWKPITPEETNFLDIDSELKPGVNPDKERFDFWRQLYRHMPKNNRLNRFL